MDLPDSCCSIPNPPYYIVYFIIFYILHIILLHSRDVDEVLHFRSVDLLVFGSDQHASSAHCVCVHVREYVCGMCVVWSVCSGTTHHRTQYIKFYNIIYASL